MNELNKKILTLLISILSVFTLILILIFNISIYNKEKKEINNKFMSINTIKEKFNDFNPSFIETDIYEVVIDNNGTIKQIYSYTQNSLTSEEIKQIIYKNIKQINSQNSSSLYLNNYLFSINRSGNLLILNNTNGRLYLLKELIKSIIIYIILEIVIVLLSLKITKWIVKPVNEAFIKQKQFIYDASHELKTPLAIIGASVETLEKNPKEKKWLENIKSENERMTKLVTNLLELSKTENIKENEVFEQINLSKLIKNKSLSFESLIYENNLELETNINNDIIFNCNQERIKELLSILMDNAIKHSTKSSKIKVELKKEKNDIILSVTNKGEEIPLSERDKIFERFYRIDKSRNRNENRYGLGLSIAKNIATSHNGNIKVNCVSGYTTFTVNFKQN